MNSEFYPEDAKFYYKKESGNRTLYRLLANDRVVASRNIPISILKNIKFLEDMNFDNGREIKDLEVQMKEYEGYIKGYKKYITKLEKDISEMEVEDIEEGDPRNFYYKRKINGVKPVIYTYIGYVSNEDMSLKKELLGDHVKGSGYGKCKKAYPSDDIIDEIDRFDEYYTFLSKKQEIKVSLESIVKIEKELTLLESKVKVLRDCSGPLRKEDIISEYFRLKKQHDESVGNDVKKAHEDIASRKKYTSNVPLTEEELLVQARMKIEAEKRRQEMLRKKLEEERRKREQLIKEEYVSPSTFLKRLGITDKTSWRKWLLKNHPDRAGPQNTDICQKVIEAGRQVGY